MANQGINMSFKSVFESIFIRIDTAQSSEKCSFITLMGILDEKKQITKNIIINFVYEVISNITYLFLN